MNTLSWLIYGAEVIDNLQILCAVGLFLLGITFCAAFLGRGITSETVVSSDFPTESDPQGTRDYRQWIFFKNITTSKLLYLCVLFCILVVVFLPSSRTLYMIAASEVGETVVTNPETIEVFNDLKSIIKNKLKEELGE